MIFSLLSILALVLALYPGSLNISGRIVAFFCFINTLMFSVFVARGGNMPELGWMGRQINVDTGLLSVHAVTAYLMLAFALFMSLSRRRDAAYILDDNHVVRIPAAASYALIAYSTCAALYIVASVGPETIISYRGYGVIKDLHEIYALNPVGKIVAGTFRFAIIFMIIISIFSLKSRNYVIFYLSFVPISIAFLMAMAEASRIGSIYFAVAAICLYLIGRRGAAITAGILALVLIGYALEARSHSNLGLAYVFRYLQSSVGDPTYFLSIITNIAGTLFVTSASVTFAVPEAYGLDYKILSLLPTINIIDGFQEARDLNEQRIAAHIPFNAFGEAWVFGPFYYIYLWVVLFYCGSCVNYAMRFGRIQFALLLGALIIGLMFASQYPLRNSLRYFYALILMRFALGYVQGWLQNRAARSQQLAALAQLRRQRNAQRSTR